MRNAIFLFLAQSPIFWRLKAFLGQVFFSIGRRFFGFRHGLREEQANYQSLRELLRITKVQLLLAILISVAMQIIDPYLTSFYEYLRLKAPDGGHYVTLLATISTIGGIFIGLYYAGISTVGSAIYSRVPNNIRNLLVRERMGNVYMRYLAFLTFMGLCLTGLCVLGFPRIRLAVPIIVLTAGIGIIAFVKLGQRAFYLFDPTRLSYAIFDDLGHYFRMVIAGGFRWNDPSFQNHANKQAKQALDALNTLADITIKEPHLQGKPFAELAQYSLGFLTNYQVAKSRIPSDSRWYEQRYIHRDWYRTEETAISVAHQTGTSLQPEVASDKLWLESKIFPILLRFIQINLKARRIDLVLELFAYIDAYLKNLSQQGELTQAFNNLDQLEEILFAEIAQQADKPVLKGEILEHLALAENLATIPITILLSYVESIKGSNKKHLSNRLASIHWQKPIDLYRQGFLTHVLPRLEWLKTRLNFELSVEDKVISPLWYQTELVAQVEAEKLAENANHLISTSSQKYQKWLDQMDTTKHPWLAAAILSREWEYWNKSQYHLGILADIWNDLSEDRYLEGLPWPDSEIVHWKQNVKNRQKALFKRMSQYGVVLSLSPRPDDFPDYGGQFLHATGETVLDSLCENDLELLKATFKPYFYGCLTKFDGLRPKSELTDWRSRQEFKIAAAPLLDIMELSGYALLLADFHNNPDLWSEITATWDEYLGDEHAAPRISMLAVAVVITEMEFELPHRAVLRTSWKQRIRHLLAKLPRKEIFNGRYLASDTVVLHNSPLVRIFGEKPFGGFHDGIDIFIAVYVRKRPDGKDLNFGRKRRDLREDLARAEKYYEKYVGSQEAEPE